MYMRLRIGDYEFSLGGHPGGPKPRGWIEVETVVEIGRFRWFGPFGVTRFNDARS